MSNMPPFLIPIIVAALVSGFALAFAYAYYDSLILAAALECGCNELASEDMQNGFVIDSRIAIRNPFV